MTNKKNAINYNFILYLNADKKKYNENPYELADACNTFDADAALFILGKKLLSQLGKSPDAAAEGAADSPACDVVVPGVGDGSLVLPPLKPVKLK